ncbi:protein Mis18-beta isoform X1 [Pyxicephalus adspersus]|uniref:protein Mis18-beta isoform X1 n=1 Tax=Pyxicephalus adspersus TaxID=30357 RepID=UPI003B5A4499
MATDDGYLVSGNDLYSIYMCNTCHNVLSEGTSVCGHNEDLAVIVFLRVTSDVNMRDTPEFGVDDDLEGCAFNHLTCKGCGTLIGFNLFSATRPYMHLRGLFCLLKQHLLCYQIPNKTIIEGIKLQFNFRQLVDSLEELKGGLVALHNHVDMILETKSP